MRHVTQIQTIFGMVAISLHVHDELCIAPPANIGVSYDFSQRRPAGTVMPAAGVKNGGKYLGNPWKQCQVVRVANKEHGIHKDNP